MAKKSDSAPSSTTTTVTSEVDDVSAPSPPQKIVLILKLGWQHMKDFYHGSGHNDLMNAVKSERKEIVQKLESGKDINQREMEVFNQSTKEKFKKRFSDFQQALYNSLELKESDDQKIKLVKIQLAKEIMQWLERLESWLVKNLSAIFDNKIPEEKVLEETEKFIKQLNSAMKPPAIEELIKKMDSKSPNDGPGTGSEKDKNPAAK